MWEVYILQCEDGSFYTGVTPDIVRRFKEHSEGRGGRYTSLHKPQQLVYSEMLNSKTEALNRERQIKGWSRKKKINLINLGRP